MVSTNVVSKYMVFTNAVSYNAVFTNVVSKNMVSANAVSTNQKFSTLYVRALFTKSIGYNDVMIVVWCRLSNDKSWLFLKFFQINKPILHKMISKSQNL